MQTNDLNLQHATWVLIQGYVPYLHSRYLYNIQYDTVLDTSRYGALGFPSSLGSMLVSGVQPCSHWLLYILVPRFQCWKPHCNIHPTSRSTHQRALGPGLRNGFDSILTSKFRWLWNGWSWIGLFGCEQLPRFQESTGKCWLQNYARLRCLQCLGETQRREVGLSDPKKSRQMWFPASIVWTLKIPAWNQALSRYISELLHSWCHSERGVKVEKKWQGPKLPQNENVTITNKNHLITSPT